MRYIWIFTLIVIDLMWFIASLKDFIITLHAFEHDQPLIYFEPYTFAFLVVHIGFILFISVLKFLEVI